MGNRDHRSEPIAGRTVYQMSALYVDTNNVTPAFTYRKWLVKLVYARFQFVVSVKTTEAANVYQASGVAQQRAAYAAKHLGNLTDSYVYFDTPENRELLGVSGPREIKTYEHMRAA